MADFEMAFQRMLKDEGGYVNNPNDPGGCTNLGISMNFLKANKIDINADGRSDCYDIRTLTPDIVRPIYKTHFWDNMNLLYDQEVATMLFGMRVNLGAMRANKLAQETCDDYAYVGSIRCDGVLGPRTIRAINNIGPTFIDAFKRKVKCYYLSLIEHNPRLAVFERGWLTRLESY